MIFDGSFWEVGDVQPIWTSPGIVRLLADPTTRTIAFERIAAGGGGLMSVLSSIWLTMRSIRGGRNGEYAAQEIANERDAEIRQKEAS